MKKLTMVLKTFSAISLLLIINCSFAIKTKDELLKKKPNSNIFLEKDIFKITYECNKWAEKSYETYSGSNSCSDRSSMIEIIGLTSDGNYIGYLEQAGYLFASTEYVNNRRDMDNFLATECDLSKIGNYGDFVDSIDNPYAFKNRCFTGSFFRLFQMLSENNGLFYVGNDTLIHLTFKNQFIGNYVNNPIVKSDVVFTYETRVGRNTIPSYRVISYETNK